MTSDLLLTILCDYVTDELGIVCIKGPSNNPAPAERPYVTVYLQNVRQVGDRFIPGPVSGQESKSKAIMQVANVQFYGVEDDGEALRSIRNALQSDEFDSFVAEHVTQREDGDDSGFSVWEIGDIVDNGFQDGTFYIKQKTMVADFQFYDFIEHTTQRMESVDVTLDELENRYNVTTNGGDRIVTNKRTLIMGETHNLQQFHVEVNDG